ncbi:MAG: HlyD family efflux transporter periplasmic adaptor subunit [Cyanobacteria bacterium P01_H01_bin.35]
MFNDTRKATLPTVSSQEFLPDLNIWTTFGGLFIVGGCTAGLIIATVTKYNVTVKAPAIVRPTGELRIVQAATGGTVADIAVSKNQAVTKGEAIATLSDNGLETEKLQLQGQIQQLQLQLVQLKAQIRSLDQEILAEGDRSKGTLALTEAELRQAKRDYQDQQLNSVAEVEVAQANLRLAEEDLEKARAEYNSIESELKSIQASLKAAKFNRDAYKKDLASCSQQAICNISTTVEETANLKLAQEELQKAQADLTSATATLKSIEASFNLAVNKLNRYQPLIASGAISQDRLDEVKLTVEQEEQAIEAQKGAILAQTKTIKRQERAVEVARARLQQALNQAQLEVEQQQQALNSQTSLLEAQAETIERQEQAVEVARAGVQLAQTSLNPSDAEVAVARERVTQESATSKARLARLNREQEALMQQQVEIQNQIKYNQKEVEEVKRKQEDFVISASESGVILQLGLRNIGQVVATGESIAEIAPIDVAVVVKARVKPGDISLVEVGQKVDMRITACPYTDYGTLRGKVVGVSPDVIVSNGAVDSFYEVTIEPERSALTVSGKAVSEVVGGDRSPETECSIQAGMEGRADIVSKQETVLQFVLRKVRLINKWG